MSKNENLAGIASRTKYNELSARLELDGIPLLTQGDIDEYSVIVPSGYIEGTDATAILQQTADAARVQGVGWRLRAGVVYTVPDGISTWTSFDGNGSKIATANNGQVGTPTINVLPMSADVQSVALITAETWTIAKGSTYIPELSGQIGWTYTIDTPTPDINRLGGTPIRQAQTFTVVTDDGQISTPIRVNFTRPFAAGTIITRQKVRKPIVIRDLDVEYATSSGTIGRERTIRVTRCNTVFENVRISNESGLETLQGFVYDGVEDVVYTNCSSGKHKINQTNYGWNGNTSTGITLIDCDGMGNRRDVDAHKCCDIRIVRGNFASGIGAHWGHGLYLEGMPNIGASNSANPFCIHWSGSDIIGAANFMLDKGSFQAVKMRDDICELSGIVNLDGSTFSIDNSADQISAATAAVYLLRLSKISASAYDAGRPVSLPSSISMDNITVELTGACKFQIFPFAIGFGQGAAQFAAPMDYTGSVSVSAKFINVPDVVEAGALSEVGQPAVRYDYVRNQTSFGAGYDVQIHSFGRPVRVYADAATMDTLSAARMRARLYDASAGSVLTVRPGGTQAFEMVRCGNPTTVQIPGSNTAVGDEYYSLYTGQFTITSDANITLSYGQIAPLLFHNGTLTADRLVTLNTAGVRDGDVFEIYRTGGGAFNLLIGGLVALPSGYFCKLIYRASGGWTVAECGAVRELVAFQPDGKIVVQSRRPGESDATVFARVAAAVAKVKAAGGGSIELGSGDFPFTSEVLIEPATGSGNSGSIKISGQGHRTRLIATGVALNSMLRVTGWNVTLTDMLIEGRTDTAALVRFDPTIEGNANLRLQRVNALSGINQFYADNRAQNWNISDSFFLNPVNACIYSANDSRNSSISDTTLFCRDVGLSAMEFRRGGTYDQQVEGLEISNLKTLTTTGRAFAFYCGFAIHMTNCVFDQQGDTSIIDGSTSQISDFGFVNCWHAPKSSATHDATVKVLGTVQELNFIGGAISATSIGLWLASSNIQNAKAMGVRFRTFSSATAAGNAGMRLSGARAVRISDCDFLPTTGAAQNVIEDDNTSTGLFTGNRFRTAVTAKSINSTYLMNYGDDMGDTTGDVKLRVGTGALSSPSYSFRDDSDTGLYPYAANVLGVVAGGALAARFNASSDAILGPGTKTPADTEGFVHLPGGSGPPTGVPVLYTNRTPQYIDRLNYRAYYYVGSAWRYVQMI